MKLYHATFRKNVQSILQNGLLIGQKCNFEGMSMRDQVYFAFCPNSAICFVESSDTLDDCTCENKEDYEIVVFEVDTGDIDLSKVDYDWNNRCEYENDIISIAYGDNVVPSALSIVENPLDIEDILFEELKHLDDDASYIWEKIGTIFDEEVENNANW